MTATPAEAGPVPVYCIDPNHRSMCFRCMSTVDADPDSIRAHYDAEHPGNTVLLVALDSTGMAHAVLVTL